MIHRGMCDTENNQIRDFLISYFSEFFRPTSMLMKKQTKLLMEREKITLNKKFNEKNGTFETVKILGILANFRL